MCESFKKLLPIRYPLTGCEESLHCIKIHLYNFM